nr:putative ribonuclease H-like domain-containing protein [Tanacetum cinerariifolium]
MESQSETIQTVFALKLHMLKTRDCDLWSIRMKQYLTHTDYALWEVIVNGDALAAMASVSGGVDAAIPPKMTEQKITRGNELKAKRTLFQLEIHGEVISQEDANLKLLRSLPPAWNTHTLIMRNKSDLDTLSMDDLYNNLKVYEAKIKGQSSSNSQNVAFLSSDNTSNTNEAVNIAHNVSAANLEQIDTDDLEEMDLKWQVAMLTMRVKRFIKKTRRNLNFNGKETISIDKIKVKSYNCHMRCHFARECRAPKSQGNISGDNTIRVVPVETPANALVHPVQILRNFMPPRPDLSFAGLDDSFFKSAISEIVTSVHETETSTSKTSKESIEKPKTVRSSSPIIEDWEFDSDDDLITNSGKVPINAAKQSSPRAAASTSTARYVNTAANRPTVNGKFERKADVRFLVGYSVNSKAFRDKDDILLVQVYVDDIIFGSTKKSLCDEFEQMMHKRFQMSSMRELTFFLGLQVKQKDDGIFISQDKYVADILKKFDFTTVKTASTPMEPNKAGSLMYLTAFRPNTMFAICACARFQVTPKTSHPHAVKRIFQYLKGQPKLGLWYPRDSPFNLEAFFDSDYAGASIDKKFTTGGCQFLGKMLISGQCKKQTVVANSTIEAEYVVAANCCRQVLWIQNQMLDYRFNFMNTKIYIDNENGLNEEFRVTYDEIQVSAVGLTYYWELVQVAVPGAKKPQRVPLLRLGIDGSMYNIVKQGSSFEDRLKAEREIKKIHDDQLGVFSTAKVLADAAKKKVNTYTRRRRAEVSTADVVQEGVKDKGYKMEHFKGKSFYEVKEMFDKVYKQVTSFVPMESDMEKERTKRAGLNLQEESSKRQNTEEGSKSTEEPRADEISQEDLQ